ncbi:MAG: PKD domain-containing protein [Bacteroidales bacterium]|nr:PKD domain-containing protein [Bacteroidales bacterium]
MKKSILLLLVSISLLIGCKKDDDGPPDPEVKSRFTVANDEYDGFKVNIKNDSEEALTYEWNFGDGNTGTQSDTAFSYTYSSTGTFTITLVAINGDVTDLSSKDVTISGMTFQQFLGGDEATGKIWRLEFDAGVVMLNPDNYNDWWYSWTKNHSLPVDLRNTIRHHQYIFKPDGSFEFKTEGWTLRPGAFFGETPDPQGWPDATSWISLGGKDCSTWGNNSSLTYEIQNASFYADCDFGRIVLKGKGGHFGPMDTGTELVVDEPAEETFYEVYHYADGGDQPDTLVLFTPWGGNENGVDQARGPQIGRITLVAYKDVSQIPDDEIEVIVEKPLETNDISDNFDDEAVNITWVEDNSPALFDENFDNPASGGINTSAKVAKYVRGTQDYANIQFELPFRMNLSTRNVFKMKVYVDAATAVKTVAVKLQDSKMGGNAWQTQTERKIQDVTDDSWVELTFDFSEVATNENYDKIIVQFGDEGANKGDGTFYFDDFALE